MMRNMRMKAYLSETSITFSIALAHEDLARSLGSGADILSNLNPALFSILGIRYSFERSKQRTEIPVLPVKRAMYHSSVRGPGNRRIDLS
jgi:hypothetical protein